MGLTNKKRAQKSASGNLHFTSNEVNIQGSLCQTPLNHFDILPHPKEWGFLLDGDVFMPGMNTMARGPYATLWHGLRAAKSRENVDRGVDVAIMMGSAIGACPFSDTQPCSTFRTATRNVSAA